jgi:hypothetical protein
MNKFPQLSLSFAVLLSLVITPSVQAKVKVSKPVAPIVAKVSSSSVSKGKVNITVTLKLPTNSSGAKITGSKVTAGGKFCLITKAKTSCTIKGLKNGAILKVRSQSKNIKGYGAQSAAVRYVAGSPTYRVPVISSVPQIPIISPVVVTPTPTPTPKPTPTPTEEVVVPPDPTLISTAAISGLSVPLPGNVPDTSVTPGTGYTASVSWSPNHAAFVSNTSYTATITLTAATDYTLTGVVANFFTVAGSSSDTNPVNSGVVTAVFAGVVYAINEVGPAGGLIFITPTTVGNTTGKYFEAAATDLSSTKAWCDITTTVGTTGSAIGDGLANTNLIAAACTSGAGQDAVDYSVILDSITYEEWFLPSQDELAELCLAAKVTRPGSSTCGSSVLKSGFASGSYWSSTEFDTSVFSHDFALGEQEASEKNYPANVRVVRTFS